MVPRWRGRLERRPLDLDATTESRAERKPGEVTLAPRARTCSPAVSGRLAARATYWRLASLALAFSVRLAFLVSRLAFSFQSGTAVVATASRSNLPRLRPAPLSLPNFRGQCAGLSRPLGRGTTALGLPENECLNLKRSPAVLNDRVIRQFNRPLDGFVDPCRKTGLGLPAKLQLSFDG